MDPELSISEADEYDAEAELEAQVKKLKEKSISRRKAEAERVGALELSLNEIRGKYAKLEEELAGSRGPNKLTPDVKEEPKGEPASAPRPPKTEVPMRPKVKQFLFGK